MAPRRKQAQETQTNPTESGSGSVHQPSSVSASVNSRAPTSAERSSMPTRSRANTRKRSAGTALDGSWNNSSDNNSEVSAISTTAPVQKKRHIAPTNTNTTTLAAHKNRPTVSRSKRQKIVSFNNSDDSNNNSYDDDSYNYDSEDGDGVQSRAFTAERKAAITHRDIIRTDVVTDEPTLTASINTVGTKIDQLSHMLQGMMEIRFGQLEGVVTGVIRRLEVREERTRSWFAEVMRIRDGLLSAVDIQQHFNTPPPLLDNQQQQQQQQQQQLQLRIELLEQQLQHLQHLQQLQQNEHHQQQQPFLPQLPLIQHHLPEPQTESERPSQVQVQARTLSQEPHPADVQPQQRLQYFHTQDHERQRVQEQAQKRVQEEKERMVVMKRQQELSTGTPQKPFLPDTKQDGLTLDLAWLEYKHFSRTLLPKKDVARLGLRPWPGGLMRSQLHVKHEIALRRRAILFKRVERLARKEDQTFEAYIGTLMERYKGQTVCAIANILENLEMLGPENVASPTTQPTKDKGKGRKDEDEGGEDEGEAIAMDN
ncbi:hypothetical protein BGX30_011373 [Mortierella sp. GBA39]|nr:hypothetical protein BGX30_011373 [Mortierella sp. GBA39]